MPVWNVPDRRFLLKGKGEEKGYYLFDLVVTDSTMPNMTGIQLAAEIKKIRPDIPIVMCTGFSNQINADKSKMLGIDGFVMKPIVKKKFAEAVQKALDG